MTQNRRPAKQIIHHKLQKQCDENKSLGGILRYKDTNTNTEKNSIKNLSKQESYEKARQYLPVGKMGEIHSYAYPHA